MGLLETIRENREKNRAFKLERREKNAIAQAKAQAAYDIEFKKGAVEAVKERARREAKERYGYSKSERRQKALDNFAKNMGGLGNIGGNMGGDIFGNKSSPRRSSSGSHRKKSGSHKKKSSRSHRTQRRERDPFDFDLPF